MVDKYQTSIFNDVLGPVMTGPSSSHTAGPGRIGLMVGALMEDVTLIDIRFPEKSSYKATYIGQGSGRAFVGGILGYEITCEEFKNSFAMAEEKGVEVKFSFLPDIPMPHPNTAYIHLSNGHDEVSATTFSVGGGAVEIVEICGTKVLLKGDAHLLAVISGEEKTDNETCCENILRERGIPFEKLTDQEGKLSLYHIFSKPTEGLLKILRQNMEARVRYIPPVMPVEDTRDGTAPFCSAAELQDFLRENPMELWEAAVYYEAQRSGWTKEQVIAYAEMLLDTMEESIQEGLQVKPDEKGLWKISAGEVYEATKEKKTFDIGVLNYAPAYATAIMENNNNAGKVCAGPTAGSCGVLGGMLFSMQRTMGCSREKMVQALLVAGLVGVFISEQATFAAEVAACQAENGSASSMAAAAAAYILEGTVQQVLNSAGIALQNLMGLICDPLAGCTVVPCITRNSVAIANAVVSANLAVGGYDPMIPFDQCVQAMLAVGKLLPRELRCTSLGGICATPAGEEIDRKFREQQPDGI